MEKLGGPKRDIAWSQALEARLRSAWDLALSAPLGAAIPTTEPEALTRHLYAYRRRVVDSGDLRLNDFAVMKAPAPEGAAADEVWLVPKAHARPKEER